MDRVESLARAGEPWAELTLAEPPRFLGCAAAEESDVPTTGAALLDDMRERSSRAALRRLGRDEGYRIEDMARAVIGVREGFDGTALARWLERRIGRAVVVVVRPGRPALAVEIAGRVGRSPDRPRYARGDDGRVLLEAFELHVTEHCNLSCANCCNMSPLVAERTLSVAEVESLVTRMASVVRADVLKIMGGEPLLHPAITEVLHVLRRSGLSPKVRLFTNGLLLGRMPEAFWAALDELTISSYASAPVKPSIMAMVRAKADQYDFVLNVKNTGEFTEVLSPRFEHDDAKTQRTFERCWLRHRCIVVRDHRFFMCTRAAYAEDFSRRVAHEAAPYEVDRTDDGVPLDHADLAGAIEKYLNRETPLGACRYCFGGDGRADAHYQLSKAEVRRGVLSRRLQWLP